MRIYYLSTKILGKYLLRILTLVTNELNEFLGKTMAMLVISITKTLIAVFLNITLEIHKFQKYVLQISH